jgi:hypothetical protein
VGGAVPSRRCGGARAPGAPRREGAERHRAVAQRLLRSCSSPARY